MYPSLKITVAIMCILISAGTTGSLKAASSIGCEIRDHNVSLRLQATEMVTAGMMWDERLSLKLKRFNLAFDQSEVSVAGFAMDGVLRVRLFADNGGNYVSIDLVLPQSRDDNDGGVVWHGRYKASYFASIRGGGWTRFTGKVLCRAGY